MQHKLTHRRQIHMKIFMLLQLTSMFTVFQALVDRKLFTNTVAQANYIPCWWSQNVVCQVLLENLSDLHLTPTQIAEQNSAHEFLCGYSSLGVSEMCQGAMTPHHLHTRFLLLYQYEVCNHLEFAHSLQRIPHSAEKKKPLSRGMLQDSPIFRSFLSPLRITARCCKWKIEKIQYYSHMFITAVAWSSAYTLWALKLWDCWF